jgi:hypothetical protein
MPKVRLRPQLPKADTWLRYVAGQPELATSLQLWVVDAKAAALHQMTDAIRTGKTDAAQLALGAYDAADRLRNAIETEQKHPS